MTKILLKLISVYQKTLSPDHGTNHRATCRFIPTCSEYGAEAIKKHGYWGVFLTIWRVIRCNPIMTKAGTVDSVP